MKWHRANLYRKLDVSNRKGSWSFLFVNVATSLVAAVVVPVTASTMALLHGDFLAIQSVTPDTP